MINLKNISKGSVYLAVALILGLTLICMSGRGEKIAEETEEYEACERRCEEKLEEILRQVDGVDDADAMVTLDELPSGKTRPQVRGVAVVVHGKSGDGLRYQLVMLISSALGITSDKIFVTFS